MTLLVTTLAPIFGLVLLGFGAVRLGVIDARGVRGLVLFVFTFAIPALLVRSLADVELPDDIEWGFLVAFYAGSFATYGVGMAVGRVGFQRALPDQALFGMAASYSNLVMMGIPVVLTALGPEASLPMLLIIGFHSATFMPVTVGLIQLGRGGRGSLARQLPSVFVETLRNPIVVAILLGFALNVAGVPLWGGLDRTLELLGAAAVPCALFAMGGALAGYSLRGELRPAAALAALKLAVHPFAVWLVGVPILGLEGLWVQVAVLLAAMPSAVNSYIFGARYEVSAEVAARAVLLGTIASVVTISVVLAVLPR